MFEIICRQCGKEFLVIQSLKGRKILWGEKIGLANMGRKLSEETKKKISEWNKEHPRERNKYGQFTKNK